MIYLMRHGRDDEDYVGGWSDVLLTKKGIKQIERQAEWIKENLHIKRIVCSNVKRALQTAEIVNKYLNVNIEINDNLKEQNKGLLNGMNKKEANIKYPEYLIDSVDTVYPEGESLRQLYGRIINNMNFFRDLEDGTLLITHRGVINALYYYLNDMPLDMNKKQFNVSFASLHELNLDNKEIHRIF